MERDSNSCIGGVVLIFSGFDGIVGLSCWFFVSCVVVNKIVDERVVFLKLVVVGDNESVYRDVYMYLKLMLKIENELLYDQKYGVIWVVMLISFLSLRNFEVVLIEQVFDDIEGYQNGIFYCKLDCYKFFCSLMFLDMFDNFVDFSMLYDFLIEVGDFYNLFLSEIYC